ncbi:hypothetical protein [Novosphingobium subterraneum]|uniref:Large polyvalent protein associated domain-containing protein n=1 Tax=Novosphingobium subterraneum TaxID=48936 RepID=A0A0B8ZJZ7_9SPHN|nr:hypothetical protein [Novosphingobium subterraneum]KHS43390.1 hypothetical protein NJ75_03699 [Novosphingobium subterraneum]
MSENPFDEIVRRKRERPFNTFRPAPEPVTTIKAEADGNEFDAIIQRRRGRMLGATLRASPAPDQAAQANRIARARGLPAAVVDPKLQVLQIADQATNFLNMTRLFPHIGSWAEANPRDAAAAADDTKALGMLGHAFSERDLSRGYSISAPKPVEPSLWNSAKGVWQSLVGGWQQMDTALSMMIDDRVEAPKWMQGGKAYSDRLKADFVQAQDNVEKATPAFKSETARGIYGGFASLAQMAPGIGASILTRSPVPAMAIAGAQVGTTAYGKYRVRGGTVNEATTGGLLEGTIEAGFEAIPMGAVVSRFGKGATSKFLAEIFVKEMATEQATTIAQDAVDTAIANPDKTWGQYFAERPAAAYQTALGVLVMSGALGGASALASKAQAPETARAQARIERRVRDAEEAQQTAGFLDQIERAATASKFRQRDPVGFANLVAQTAQAQGIESAYIPATASRDFIGESESYL